LALQSGGGNELARRTRPARTTSIELIIGECNGKIRSTPISEANPANGETGTGERSAAAHHHALELLDAFFIRAFFQAHIHPDGVSRMKRVSSCFRADFSSFTMLDSFPIFPADPLWWGLHAMDKRRLYRLIGQFRHENSRQAIGRRCGHYHERIGATGTSMSGRLRSVLAKACSRRQTRIDSWCRSSALPEHSSPEGWWPGVVREIKDRRA